MGSFNTKKVTSISLSIYSINEVEDLIIKMAKLIEEGYSINTASSLRYGYGIQDEPICTIELTKYTT